MNGEIRDTSKQTSAFYALQYDFAVILQTISHLIRKKNRFFILVTFYNTYLITYYLGF